MKSVAFVLLLCAACEPSQLDYPIQPSTNGPHSSGVVGGGSLVDAGGAPGGGDGGVGDGDGGALSDAGGLGPDAAPQLDAGVPDFFDASVPPQP